MYSSSHAIADVIALEDEVGVMVGSGKHVSIHVFCSNHDLLLRIYEYQMNYNFTPLTKGIMPDM